MISIDENALLTILLMFLRVFSFISMVPIFGTFTLPPFVRTYFAFALSASLLMFIQIEPVRVETFPQFLKFALAEAAFGFTAGFFLRMLFEAVFVAGEIVAVSSGLGFLMMFLPQQPQTTVLAGFSTMLASTLFLTMGGAEALYVGLAESFKNLPVGSFNIYSLDGGEMLKLFYRSFAMGVKLALPVLIASILTNVILALVNRFIPQINVFMVGLPLQVIIGLVVFMLSLPVLGLVLASYMKEYIRAFVLFMANV